MANIIYMSIEGQSQGLISQGCSTASSIGNLYQTGHEDQIFVYEFTSGISRDQNANHRPVLIKKPVDKSSPLLGVAISENELLQIKFYFYRTSSSGGLELYYQVRLIDATLSDMTCFYPNSLTHNTSQPQDSLAINYKSISWRHLAAGTDGYSFWEDRIY